MRRLVAVLLVVLAGLLAGCGGGQTETPGTSEGGEGAEKQVKLGIIQIVEHPALDAARQGFLDVLAENGYKDGENLEVDFRNAQNEQATLQAIADKFANDPKDLILAIATPSAQAAADKTSDIPILITAVTDPVAAKLVKSMEKPGTNVTGTTDMNPIKEQLELITKIVPDAKKIGVIYNSSEVNSQVQVNICKEVAPELGLEIVEAPITASSEVMQGAQSLVGKVDAIYIPTDNTVVSACASVIKVGEENQIPVFAGEGNTVKSGAIATLGIDYYKLGRQTGEMALRVLDGANPAEMPIESQKDLKLTINPAAAERMGVTIPEELITEDTEIIKE
ncbi:MAG: ABC transporter substrate-binding protein [Peptococcaceae bacterium]|nr:ABC transporter substrate-binding protein [Peptococcaceae bacterium]